MGIQVKETLKKIWAVRQRNRAKIGLFHIILSLILFFLWYTAKVDIYATFIGLNVLYTLLCLWCLFEPKAEIEFWTKNVFVFWNIFTQSIFFLFAGLKEMGWNFYLLIPFLNICLGFMTMRRLGDAPIRNTTNREE